MFYISGLNPDLYIFYYDIKDVWSQNVVSSNSNFIPNRIQAMKDRINE